MITSNNEISGWNADLQFWGPFLPVWGAATGTPSSMYDYKFGEIFETCPEGYHRPSDGYIDQISYNGPYPNYKRGSSYVTVSTDGIVKEVAQTNYSSQIAFSELRQSLYTNPLSGDAGVNDNVGANVGVTGVVREQNFWQDNSVSVNADAVKTSAGALHTLPVCREQSLRSTLKFLKDSGFRIVAATEKGDYDYTKADSTDNGRAHIRR